MNRFTATCKFCDWTEKGSGVFDRHYRAVRHVRDQHPEIHQRIEAAETEIHQLCQKMQMSFGDAAPIIKVM